MIIAQHVDMIFDRCILLLLLLERKGFLQQILTILHNGLLRSVEKEAPRAVEEPGHHTNKSTEIIHACRP
jgi:hypothetical protein